VEVNPDIPKTLSDIIMKSLSKEPSSRFSSGREMAEALAETIKKPKEETQATKTQTKSLKPALLVIAFLLAAAVIVSIVLFTSKKETPSINNTVEKPVAEQAIIEIDSDPSGAQIFIDGQVKGTSPAKITAEVGKHEVRLSMPGYYEWEAEVVLNNKGQQLPKIELVPVEDKSAPSGAD
jgi:serine/threonine protein kinase